MVTHSSILAWKIPWTEEPSGLGRLQSMGCVRLSFRNTHSIPLCHSPVILGLATHLALASCWAECTAWLLDFRLCHGTCFDQWDISRLEASRTLRRLLSWYSHMSATTVERDFPCGCWLLSLDPTVNTVDLKHSMQWRTKPRWTHGLALTQTSQPLSGPQWKEGIVTLNHRALGWFVTQQSLTFQAGHPRQGLALSIRSGGEKGVRGRRWGWE